MYSNYDNMSKDVKAAWTAALRSGKIAQARGTLQDNTGAMCCLGVLCSVIDLNWRNAVIGDLEHITNKIDYNERVGMRLRTINIGNVYGGLSNETCAELGCMNDGGGGTWNDNRQSFAQIADWIDANIEGK